MLQPRNRSNSNSFKLINELHILCCEPIEKRPIKRIQIFCESIEQVAFCYFPSTQNTNADDFFKKNIHSIRYHISWFVLHIESTSIYYANCCVKNSITMQSSNERDSSIWLYDSRSLRGINMFLSLCVRKQNWNETKRNEKRNELKTK